MFTKLILVRHGETLWAKENRYQGHKDVELSEEGRKQVKLLARRLAKEKITAIYSSDLQRASETAKAIAKLHHREVKETPLLREISFGDWEGLKFEEIEARDEELVKKWKNDLANFRPPQGESLPELKARAEKFLQEILKIHKEENIIVVSHGGFIRIILCSLLNLDFSKFFWSIEQDLGAISIIKFFEENKPVISLLNDTCHLAI
jgi:alpha-ribazole phosphatase